MNNNPEKTAIVGFLKRNDFEKIEKNSYANQICNVVFDEGELAVANSLGEAIYHKGYSLLWLVGALTYYGFIDRNYKK